MATEEPKFELLSKHDAFELRRYPAFIVAETTVEGDMDAASGKGFRAIADYIFGNNRVAGTANNQASEKIAMTAPVAMQPLAELAQDKVATTPLHGSKQWRVHFVMLNAPSSVTCC